MRILMTGFVVIVTVGISTGVLACSDPAHKALHQVKAELPIEVIEPLVIHRAENADEDVLRVAGNAVCNPRVEVCEE